MTIYSKEMKTTRRRRVENAMKEKREDRILLGGDFNGRIGERGARNWEKKIQKQGRQCRGEQTDGTHRRKWMGSIEREQTRRRRRRMDL
jgi:hypothetical protein